MADCMCGARGIELESHKCLQKLENWVTQLRNERDDLVRALAVADSEVSRLNGVVARLEEVKKTNDDFRTLERHYEELAAHHNKHCTCGDIY